MADILDSWRDTGAWWDGELEKTFWRVETSGGGVFELWQDTAGAWGLWRVWD